MKSSRLEWRVGLFVLVGLILLGTLMIQFSKGGALFSSTYELHLITKNVGAIKPHASVLMAGVQVGWVVNADLNPNGRQVSVRIKVYKRYPIRADAHFFIDQSGFLGDQFVSITPFEAGPPAATNAISVPGAGPKVIPYLKDGQVVHCEEPFNLQDAAREAVGLMKRLDSAVQTIQTAAQRVDRVILSDSSLRDVTNTVTNFRHLSEKLVNLAGEADTLLSTNRATIQTSVTNLAHFSEQLNHLATELHTTLATNQSALSTTVTNLASASGQAKDILTDLRAGKGLAGSLLEDQQLRGQFGQLMTNLTTLSSNLNRYGLLYKPKQPKAAPAKRLYPGNNPFHD